MKRDGDSKGPYATHDWKERFSSGKVSHDRVLTSWYTGDYEQIADAKRGQMDKGGFQRILDAFPSGLHMLQSTAEKIRSTLFPFHDRIFTGTQRFQQSLRPHYSSFR